MTIELWIDQLQLEQMMSNIEDAASAAEEPFENLVEYTTLPALEGQICISINYDTYITLTDNGLLEEWAINDNQ
jgi:hypothetical protein|tara:strand:- start:5015 stop:5236 length:222 start_codon:yes stop_codon:yes gene_type:complete